MNNFLIDSVISATKQWNKVINQNKAMENQGIKQNRNLYEDDNGIGGLINSYSGRTKYHGKYDEDLTYALQHYELTCTLCSLNDEQKRKGIMVM